jgi:hypothetical protein
MILVFLLISYMSVGAVKASVRGDGGKVSISSGGKIRISPPPPSSQERQSSGKNLASLSGDKKKVQNSVLNY